MVSISPDSNLTPSPLETFIIIISIAPTTVGIIDTAAIQALATVTADN